jgi:hypothetical protein
MSFEKSNTTGHGFQISVQECLFSLIKRHVRLHLPRAHSIVINFTKNTSLYVFIYLPMVYLTTMSVAQVKNVETTYRPNKTAKIE